MLLSTGQAMVQSWQAVQVSITSYLAAARMSVAACLSPDCSRRSISRKVAIRWRGEKLSAEVGHVFSQKPHSMHLSTRSSTTEQGLMFFTCTRRSSFNITPGLSRAAGSKICLMRFMIL
ncbi:hypothetical protein D3C77_640940 [compost metagenome]